MAARSIGSGVMTFGLVTIPFKVYTAVSEQAVSFAMLHAECGTRVRSQLFCPAHNRVIEHAETVKGYEHTRDQYLALSREDLDALKSARAGELVLEEFVPADTVDPIHIESSYYLGPDKGGAVAYAVLADALRRAGRVGVGRYARQGKDLLVLVRPYRDGLMMHEAHYATEIRPWEDLEVSAVDVPRDHAHMAGLLVAQLERDAFDPSRFRDEYAERVRALVARKLAGEPIVVEPPKAAPVIGLLEALQRSVAANSNTIAALGGQGPKKAKVRPKKADEAKKRGRAK